MAVIATAVWPEGLTRIFFDCRMSVPHPADEIRIADAVERAHTMAAEQTAATAFRAA